MCKSRTTPLHHEPQYHPPPPFSNLCGKVTKDYTSEYNYWRGPSKRPSWPTPLNVLSADMQIPVIRLRQSTVWTLPFHLVPVSEERRESAPSLPPPPLPLCSTPHSPGPGSLCTIFSRFILHACLKITRFHWLCTHFHKGSKGEGRRQTDDRREGERE